MIDQVGHPDYSLREMIDGLRQVRDAIFALSEISTRYNEEQQAMVENAMDAKVARDTCPTCHGTGNVIPGWITSTDDKVGDTPMDDQSDEPLRELCYDYRNANTIHAENYFQRIVRWVKRQTLHRSASDARASSGRGRLTLDKATRSVKDSDGNVVLQLGPEDADMFANMADAKQDG